LTDPIKAFQFSQLLRQAAVWISAIVIARSGLSLEAIGLFEWILFLGFTSLFFWLSSLIQDFLKTPGSSTSALKETFSILFYRSGILSLLVSSPVAFYGIIQNDTTYLYGAAYILTMGPATLIHYYLYAANKTGMQITITLLYFTGYLALSAAGAWLFKSIETVLMLLSLLQMGMLFVALPLLSIHISRKQIWPLLPISSRWLTAIAIFGGLGTVVDGFLVKSFFDEEGSFALYRYGAREIPLAALLMTSLGQAYLPLFKENFSVYKHQYVERNRRLQHYLFPLYAALLIGSNFLFNVLYGGRFVEAVLIFDLMILLICLRFINTNAILVALGEEKALFSISWQEVIVNVVVSLCLLPAWGLAGIVVGTLVANLFEKIRSVLYLQKKKGLTWHDYMPSGTYWLYTLLLLTIFLLKHILLTIF
jgi:hypothetical protein